MGSKLVEVIKSLGVEDVFLVVGTVLLSVGAATAFGLGVGLMVAGALCLIYGIWITVGLNRRGGE
jgi:hypothetical protein